VEVITPATRNGSTSQFGIRRLRKSVKVATARTIRVGHHAIECIFTFLSPTLKMGIDLQFVIQMPESHMKIGFKALRSFHNQPVFTVVYMIYPRVKRRIYTLSAIG
jgi:hypothetical protein